MEKETKNNLFTEKKEEIKDMVQLFVRSGIIEDESINFSNTGALSSMVMFNVRYKD